jgi:hypothetical protein
VFNPATRALEIAPAYRDKAAKTLMHELRRTKLGLYFTFARLYCLKFALQSRGVAPAAQGRARFSRTWSSKIFSKATLSAGTTVDKVRHNGMAQCASIIAPYAASIFAAGTGTDGAGAGRRR